MGKPGEKGKGIRSTARPHASHVKWGPARAWIGMHRHALGALACTGMHWDSLAFIGKHWQRSGQGGWADVA
jgi:hypothetical protein